MSKENYLVMRRRIREAATLKDLNKLPAAMDRCWKAGAFTPPEFTALDDLMIRHYELLKERHTAPLTLSASQTDHLLRAIRAYSQTTLHLNDANLRLSKMLDDFKRKNFPPLSRGTDEL